MTRIVLLGVLLYFILRLVGKLLIAVFTATRADDQGVAGSPKRREDDIDMTKVKDVDFRDIDS